MRPSIPGPVGFTMPPVQRSFFAITYGCQARLLYAKIGQKSFYTFSPPFAQRQIVAVGASLITMTFNGYRYIGVGSQPLAIFCQRLYGLWCQCRLVKLEENVFLIE